MMYKKKKKKNDQKSSSNNNSNNPNNNNSNTNLDHNNLNNNLDNNNDDDDNDTLNNLIKFNYADSAGAKILKYSNEIEKANSIIQSNNDVYMLVPCNANKKSITIQLSEDVLITEVLLANKEHYSGSFQDFEIRGSDLYPAKEWISLGTFKATKTYNEQLFNINTDIFVKYIKIIFNSYYGREYYCTLTSLVIHGKNMMESLREEMELSKKAVADVIGLVEQQDEQEVIQVVEQEQQVISSSDNELNNDKQKLIDNNNDDVITVIGDNESVVTLNNTNSLKDNEYSLNEGIKKKDTINDTIINDDDVNIIKKQQHVEQQQYDNDDEVKKEEKKNKYY